MGIDTKFSTNPSMVLGAIDPGVSPLEMAHAYQTIAADGERVGGNLDSTPGPNDTPYQLAPVAIDKVTDPGGDTLAEDKPRKIRVLSSGVASTMRNILRENVLAGTGVLAQSAGNNAWGKTGTTENNGDAWFVGGNDDMTIAVWVGYADKVQSMETEHAGSPVAGGTFPAEIFHDFMTAWLQMRDTRRAARHQGEDPTETPASPTQTIDPNAVPDAEQPTDTAPSDKGNQGNGRDQPNATPAPETPPQTPPPETPAPAPPAPTPTQPPTGGGGTGGGVTPNGTTP
jgi:penicillin-binding protein 1A